jgi:hypothetical protein
MACCKCCCGGSECSEGQEGKCCCGGAEGVCCQTGERCCDGTCQAVTCCPSSCDDENPCAEDCYCCDGTCQAEPCCDCVDECTESGWICCDGEPVEATCCPTCDESNPCNEGCQCCGGACIPDEATCCTGSCDEENPCSEGCQCCNGECIPDATVCCTGPCDEENPPPPGCVCEPGDGGGTNVPDPGPGCCCVNGTADTGIQYPWDCASAGGVWKSGGSCSDSRCQYCLKPSEWRVLDGDDNVYLSGVIVDSVLRGFPDPWTPEFNYESIELRLEVFGCDATWHVIESWNLLFDPCVDAGYPTHTFAQPWPPPAPCDCAFDPDTDAVIEPCVPCPELTAIADPYVPSSGDSPYRCNDGNKPTRGGAAATFTAAVDGEWINLANWQDGNGVSPAGSLPGAGDTVTIAAGAIVSSCAGAVPSVHTLKIEGELQIEIEAVDLVCPGLISPINGCNQVVGKVTTSRLCVFTGNAELSGDVVPQGEPATFRNNARVIVGGEVQGNARFEDTSENRGTVQGDATFDGVPATNIGAVLGNGTFDSGGSNTGTVALDATFRGNSDNVGIVSGNATFRDSSLNGGVVSLDASFSDNSSNGNVFLDGNVVGTATFNDNACNGPSSTAGTFVPNPPPSC